MAKFKVFLREVMSVSVTVEAEDAYDAIEDAIEEKPGGICAHCSGWGQRWSRNGGEELEVVEVVNADGETVWSEPEGGEQP